MKLTLQLQLLPDEQQASLLLDTMRRFNEAATFAARAGFKANVFSQPSIHKLAYFEIRRDFGLSAQLAVRAIGKACEAFARNKTFCPVFRPDGAITYDERILSFKDCHQASIDTIKGGRQRIPYVFGAYQATRLDRIRGQSDLVYRDGKFYLYCTIQFDEPPPVEPSDWLGIDLGIVRLATDSTGESFSGSDIDHNHKRRATARKQYQRRGTKNGCQKL